MAQIRAQGLIPNDRPVIPDRSLYGRGDSDSDDAVSSRISSPGLTTPGASHRSRMNSTRGGIDMTGIHVSSFIPPTIVDDPLATPPGRAFGSMTPRANPNYTGGSNSGGVPLPPSAFTGDTRPTTPQIYSAGLMTPRANPYYTGGTAAAGVPLPETEFTEPEPLPVPESSTKGGAKGGKAGGKKKGKKGR